MPPQMIRHSSLDSKMDDAILPLAPQYRRRAEEIRHSARSEEGPAREILLQLAECYELAAKIHEHTSFSGVEAWERAK